MAGNYKYLVEIKFSDVLEESLLLQTDVEYARSNGNRDEFIINGNCIKITAYRHNRTNISDIFSNHQSALYKQIVKSLIYYYCRIGEAHSIEYIKISLSHKDIHLDELIFGDSINQVVNSVSDLSILKSINEEQLKVIFGETKISHSLQFALTHFIKSYAHANATDSFERKWKAFNALYKEVPVPDPKDATKSLVNPNENDFHKALRKYMVANPNSFPLICSKVDSLTVDVIRNNTRWIKLILNDYDEAKTKALKYFILRNNDCRLMQITKDTLSVREEYLVAKGYYNEVTQHIESNLTNKNNIHLSATLCIKYAYFLRNKSIHAEKMDSGFRLLPLSKEEIEAEWISELLSLMIIDIINTHDQF